MTTKAEPTTRKMHVATARAAPSAAVDAGPTHATIRLTYLVGQLDRIVSRRLAEALAIHGLTLPQFTALSVLNARGRSSNAQLAERSLITPQSANEVVKTMEASGLIMPEPDPTNRRIVLLQLTSSGKTLLKRCDATVALVEQSMLDRMSEEEELVLRQMLQDCVRNLRSS